MEIVKPQGTETMTQVFHVDIKQHQEWYFATSEELPGLFVGNRSYEVVCKNIPEAIQTLLHYDQQQNVEVKEAPVTIPRLLGHKVFTATQTAA